MSRIVHIFYDVHMGASYQSLQDILHVNAKRKAINAGEVAVFLNKAWTAVKILAPNGLMLYYRSPSASVITPELIRFIPAVLGGKPFVFSQAQETSYEKEYEARFKERLKRLKVAYA